MTVQPFRFIHAADLHIEMPINGLLECPVYLEDKLLDAPRMAAQRLFRFAAEEKVDFIVLSGDVIDPQITGPWGLLFLINEFERLNKEGIQVYWAGGKIDSPEDLPSAFDFPPNVHFFPVGHVEEYIVKKENIPFARVLGTSAGRQLLSFRPPELKDDTENLFTVCAFYGKVSAESVRGEGIQYWALGGDHKRDFLLRTPVTIHYPGVSLARNQRELGDYGASLVEVNEFGRVKVDLIKTSPLRWQTERLVIHSDMSEEQILSEMRSRLKNLKDVQNDVLLLVSWRVETQGSVIQELRYGNLGQSLLRDLRADFAKEEPVIYSIDIKPILPDTFESDLYDQQTILGDYLRMLHYYQENPDQKLDMTPYFPDEFREFISVQAENAKRQSLHEEKKANGEALTGDDLLSSAMDVRAFRTEVPYFVNLLSLESEWTGKQKDPLEQEGKVETELHRLRMERRTAVLREAGMMGIELLSGDDTNITGRKSTGPPQNPMLLQERRTFLQDADEKESQS